MAILDISSFLSNTFIFQIFIPFIILFAIFWGLLEAIGKLGHKVNLVLAVGFSLIAAYSNPFILSYIATLGSTVAVVLFGVLFLFGIIRWGLGRGGDIYRESASSEKRLEYLMKEKERWEKKYNSVKSDSEKAEILKRVRDIDTQMEILRRSMNK